MKYLITKLSPCRKCLQGSRRHPGFQFKIELVKQVGFRLEVDEQRAVRYASLLSYHRRRRAQPMSNNHAGRRRHDRIPLILASRSGHTFVRKLHDQYIRERLVSQFDGYSDLISEHRIFDPEFVTPHSFTWGLPTQAYFEIGFLSWITLASWLAVRKSAHWSNRTGYRHSSCVSRRNCR